jgi:hypothetical protein
MVVRAVLDKDARGARLSDRAYVRRWIREANEVQDIIDRRAKRPGVG